MDFDAGSPHGSERVAGTLRTRTTRCLPQCPVQEDQSGALWRTSPTADTSSTLPFVEEVVLRGGSPIEPEIRAPLETWFGHSFNNVRIHTDSRANDSAQAVQALAYTVGPHIVFREGSYKPDTAAGRRLLVHEFAHVLQQSGGASSSGPAMIAPRSGALEEEAKSASRSVIGDSHPRVNSSGGIILARGEKWDAITAVGPWDAYKANELANDALARAVRNFPRPTLHNGAGDAWRHCYWSCAMSGELGRGQAKEVGDIHEKYGGNPPHEKSMDLHNNAMGRVCGGKDCDICCQDALDAGRLQVLDSKGAIVPSAPVARPSVPAPGSGGYQY